MQPCTMKKRIGQGASKARPSMRNSRRYLRTSPTDGEFGEPRFTSNTPFFFILRCRFELNELETFSHGAIQRLP